MRMTALLLLPVLATAGCTAESHLAPVSTAGNSSGSASTEPEPSNSLPRGSSMMEPLTGPAGNIGTARVGPATTGRADLARGTY